VTIRLGESRHHEAVVGNDLPVGLPEATTASDWEKTFNFQGWLAIPDPKR